MKQKETLSALLRADAQTAKTITEMYPADWDMDAVFRRSCKKFRQRSAEASRVQNPADAAQPRHITHCAGRWITAACLMLIAGLAGGVAWMQLSVPEPSVTMQTDTTSTVPLQEQTAPTDPVSDAPQQTAATSADETAPNHGTDAPVQTTDSSPSEPVPVQTQPSDSPQSTADMPQTTAASTESPQTQLTGSQQTEPPPSAVQTPDASGTAASSTVPDVNGEEPSNEPEPTSSRWTVRDNGTEFTIIYEFEDHTLYPSPDFTVDLAGYTVSINRPNDYTVSNTISNEEADVCAGVTFSSGVSSSSVYRYSQYSSYTETLLSAQNGYTEAYLLSGETDCMLIWFDGRYLCRLWGNAAQRAELIQIAKAMTTH